MPQYDPRPGECYRHYKGGMYTVIFTSIKEDTLETLVTYWDPGNTRWTRTLANFLELVDGRPRFALVEDTTDGSH